VMWSSLETVLMIVITSTLTLGLSWILYPACVVRVAVHLEWTVEELIGQNIDDHDDDRTKILQLEAPPVLSLVIPAYNEQDGIPIMLQESFGFLNSVKGFSHYKHYNKLVGIKRKLTTFCLGKDPCVWNG
jgi:hypothetical protein